MPRRSETGDDPCSRRDKIIGLGERSIRKSYYPQLVSQLTELEQSRNQLAESEARYRSLVENINEVIFSLDANGIITYVSPVVKKCGNILPEKILGRKFVEFAHPEDQPALAAAVKRVLAGTDEFHEFRLVGPNGEVRHVRTSSRPLLKEGLAIGVTGVITDITEKKQAEEALRESDARYRRIVDTATEGIWMLNQDWATVFVNASLARMLGYPIEAMIGRKFTDFLFEEDLADHEERINRRQRRLAEQYERRFRRQDGQTLWALVSATPVLDNVGRCTGSFAMLTDITERKQVEEELKRYRDSLEETVEQRTVELRQARDAANAANKAKSVFLANMSHELRTPLNAILGFSSMMRRDPQLADAQAENLDIINRSGEHLLALINDVLEMAKIEAGRLQLEIAPFDLGTMVRDVADMMRLRAESKGLYLRLDQSSQFPRFIRGDEVRLRQILVNLVGNAVKFTKTGGIVIHLGVKRDDRLHLLIEVKDTGPGIGAKDRERVFKPFVQLAEGAEQQGTGLGLTITKQFVDLMGGSIAVEGAPGKGSIFRVEVLVELADPPATEPTEHRDVVGLVAGQPVHRILIAEDQRDSALLLTRLMENLGLKTRSAENGVKCVQLFREWHPSLIWMDRRMPLMDGLEATRRIRQLPGGKDVKIVAVTASALKEQQDEALVAGMDAVVRKPYRFDEIYDCLARQLGLKYIYASGEDAAEFAPITPTPEMMAALPKELCQELRSALEQLNGECIGKLLEQVTKIDADLGHALSSLADQYNYEAILQVLDGIPIGAASGQTTS